MWRSLEETSRWGVLPAMVAVAIVLGVRLGALALPRSLPRERALFGAVGVLAALVLSLLSGLMNALLGTRKKKDR